MMDKLYLAIVSAWNRRNFGDDVNFTRLVYAPDMDTARIKTREWFESEFGNFGVNDIEISEPL